MAFYAFVLEPPAPRTEFRDTEPTKSEETEDVRARAFEQAMVNVLIRFPEAYRAVLEDMRRLQVEEKKSP